MPYPSKCGRCYKVLIYKIDVSWYYCPSANGRLRLSRTTKQIKICGGDASVIHSLPEDQLNRLSALDKSFIERRESPRLLANCEAEVLADLSILDSETTGPVQPLVFMGQTKDLSSCGISLVIPSLLIDERFCTDGRSLGLSLYLPEGPVSMAVTPVRCLALSKMDGGMGYLLGARITEVLDHREEFEHYLLRLTPITNGSNQCQF